MKAVRYRPSGRGPFRAEQIRPGDPYELSDGHAIVCEPSGRRHGRKHLVGGAVLATDPAVEEVGVEVGHVLDPWTLRAPDVSVGGVSDETGFAHKAPALAVEYVEADADERDLARKIAQLLAAGSELVWVVRLGGERRVEVHRSGVPVAVARAGQSVAAPGVLRNPVPVEALYERDAAHAFMLQNLLERAGFAGIDGVRADGQLSQARATLHRVCARRVLQLDAAQIARIDGCADLATLDRWIDAALTAIRADEIFGS